MPKKFLLFVSLSLVFILFAGLSLPSCSKKQPSETSTAPTTTPIVLPSTPLTTTDAKSMDATILANYESAETKARGWKNDAKFYMVSVKLPLDLSLNSATQTYTYGSSGAPNDWWTYSYSEATGKYVRALIPKEDYLGNVSKSIDKKYWRTNYVEAFQIAEANGGLVYRQANNNTSVILTLWQSEPKGWLWWLVEYKTPGGNSLKVRINPNDRTVVDDSGNVIATPGTPTSATTDR